MTSRWAIAGVLDRLLEEFQMLQLLCAGIEVVSRDAKRRNEIERLFGRIKRLRRVY